MNHLRDEEIQAYLDGGAAADAGRAADHLGRCPVCRTVCEEYRTLYAALADESHVCDPTRVSVGATAPGIEREGRAHAAGLSDTVVTGGAIAVVLAAAVLVFVNVGGVGPGASGVVSAFGQLLRQVVELPASLWRPDVGAHYETGAIITAGLVVCVALVLDRILLAPRLAGTRPPGRGFRP